MTKLRPEDSLLLPPKGDRLPSLPRADGSRADGSRAGVLRWVCTLLFVSALVSTTVMGLRWFRLLEGLEFGAFDHLMRLRPSEKPDKRLLIVAITKQDIDQLGNEYPISDQTLLTTLQTLNAHQPRVIGIDLYREQATGTGWTELTQYLKQNSNQNSNQSDRIIPICVHPYGNHPESGIAPPPGLPALQTGFADATIDPDGVVRRHLLALDPPNHSPCSASYSLSAQLVRHYLKAVGISLKFPTLNQWQFGSTRFNVLESRSGFYQQPALIRGHQILLNYRMYNSLSDIADQVSLTDVLNHQVDSALIQDRIVLIGVTDPTVKDDFSTPYGSKLRGLIFHAQMVSQLLSAVEDHRFLLRFWAFWIEIGWIWLWSVTGGVVIYWIRTPLRRVLATGVLMILLWGISLGFMVIGGVVVPLVPTLLAIVLAGGVLITLKIDPQSHPQ
ncbi:MAG: CHASE2 domain-containing protein [Leptolyngbyaceae cyanobacterium CRU_2_3]|nr:CHASE2 domain-containing protein [Leptolyngbyaceae cyanobacterium CRU_2_3]